MDVKTTFTLSGIFWLEDNGKKIGFKAPNLVADTREELIDLIRQRLARGEVKGRVFNKRISDATLEIVRKDTVIFAGKDFSHYTITELSTGNPDSFQWESTRNHEKFQFR